MNGLIVKIVLVHGCSRAVYCTLKEAKRVDKRFTVFVTESRPDMSGSVLYFQILLFITFLNIRNLFPKVKQC